MQMIKDMIISGFVSKLVNDCGDILKSRIKDADKNRNPNEKNMETRSYQVMIDALNHFSYNEHKKEERVFDAAECMLRQFKDGRSDYVEAVKEGLKIVASNVTDDICRSFLEALCYEICQEENRALAIAVILFWQEQTSGSVQEGFRRNDLSAEEINRKLDYLIKEFENKNKCGKRSSGKNYIENRAGEYAGKWEKNVFLNDFNKRDQNAGVNIKLKDIYLEKHLPHYIWKTGDEPFDELRDLLREYTTDKAERKLLLILGHPGIGKSTLITWMMVHLAKREDDFFVYQFASDLGHVNWKSNHILDEIFESAGCAHRELEGKTVILDGFDEIYINGNDRERILSKMNQELKKMNSLKKFSLIVTCRQNYVEQLQLSGIDFITLQAWNEEQIRSFCEIYEKKNTREKPEEGNSKNLEIKIKKILENKEVFGIPLILYMVLALNVDVERDSSMAYIYDQIFSLKGGSIYERCYDMEHRINLPEIREEIHQVSQRIAFWIFENNPEQASIPQKEFQKICDHVVNETGEGKESLQSNVLIGNYFTAIKHCEGIGTDELQFVHRSIYEYFVAVYFFECIHKLTSREAAAGKLGELLKQGRLSKQILEFTKYKFDRMEGYDLAEMTKGVFNLMLRHGMTYYAKADDSCQPVIKRERRIFSNMLDVVILWNSALGKLDERIIIYLQCNREHGLYLSGMRLVVQNLYMERADLRGVFLREADLRRTYLRGADLKGADLIRADLRGADLRGAHLGGADLGGVILRKADLRGADLGRADLKGADLRGAHLSRVYLAGINLSGAYLRRADLRRADLRGADLDGADLSGTDLTETIFNEDQVALLHTKYDLSGSNIELSETGEIISYQKYCTRKRKRLGKMT